MNVRLLESGYCLAPEKLMKSKTGQWAFVKVPSLFGVCVHPTRGVVLIDTGYDDDNYARATARLPYALYRWALPMTIRAGKDAVAQLNSLGFQPQDVRFIIITHFHADHICGLKSFPRAQFVYGREGLNHFNSMSWSLKKVMHAFLPDLLPDDFKERSIALDFPSSISKQSSSLTESSTIGRVVALPMEPGRVGHDIFNDGSIVITDLPGHCCGHLGVYVRGQLPRIIQSDLPQREQLILFCGDACWHSDSFQKGDWPHALTFVMVHHDGKAYRETLGRLTNLTNQYTNEELLIIPSHCPEAFRAFQELSGL